MLLLLALALIELRERRAAPLLAPVVSAVGVWALLNAPAFLSGRAQWDRFWVAAWERGADQGTVWTIVAQTAGLPRDVGLPVAWTLVALWVLAVTALVVLAPLRPRLSQVALLLVAGVLLLGLSYEPEQALWLLPLAALARPRWRDLLVWQACEVVYLALYWWWRGGLLTPGGEGPAPFYWLAIGVHVAGTLWLVAVVVRDVWWPQHDPVRRVEDDLLEEWAAPTAPTAPAEPAQVTTTRSNEVVV